MKMNEFMANKDLIKKLIVISEFDGDKIDITGKFAALGYLQLSQKHYNNNWNEIIRILQKIHDLHYNLGYSEERRNLIDNIHTNLINLDIEGVFNAIYNYLKITL